ncbi:glycoside hydrolase family 25 protein [Bacterioplanoides sp.]|uniref:glycoside hydrolase family 25 protein n=1 Tax=Bacterioplanoides sp. TaxID=2066072 RepID=UPI003B5CC963
MDTLALRSEAIKKLSAYFSQSFLTTTRFSLLNILLLAGFVIPLIYISVRAADDDNLFDSLFICNPYIEQIVPSHLPSNTSCQPVTTLHPSDIQKGIDVSHYQGEVLWHRVAASGKSFAIAKATGGENYTDPSFTNNWYGIRRHELIRGAYHFFYAGDDPEKQAEHYLDTVGQIRKNDLPPILDVEITDEMSPELLIEHTLIWLETVEKATKRKPIVYTDSAFGQEFLTDPRFGHYYLWLADYSNENPPAPQAWKKKRWFLLQHAQNGKVDGIKGNVDLSHYRGSLANLKAFIQQSNL